MAESHVPQGSYVTLSESGPRDVWMDKFEDWRSRAELADAEVKRLRDVVEDANAHASRAIAKLNRTYSNRHTRAAQDELAKALDILQAVTRSLPSKGGSA